MNVCAMGPAGRWETLRGAARPKPRSRARFCSVFFGKAEPRIPASADRPAPRPPGRCLWRAATPGATSATTSPLTRQAIPCCGYRRGVKSARRAAEFPPPRQECGVHGTGRSRRLISGLRRPGAAAATLIGRCRSRSGGRQAAAQAEGISSRAATPLQLLLGADSPWRRAGCSAPQIPAESAPGASIARALMQASAGDQNGTITERNQG